MASKRSQQKTKKKRTATDGGPVGHFERVVREEQEGAETYGSGGDCLHHLSVSVMEPWRRRQWEMQSQNRAKTQAVTRGCGRLSRIVLVL
jgi:hypothetical protein